MSTIHCEIPSITEKPKGWSHKFVGGLRQLPSLAKGQLDLPWCKWSGFGTIKQPTSFQARECHHHSGETPDITLPSKFEVSRTVRVGTFQCRTLLHFVAVPHQCSNCLLIHWPRNTCLLLGIDTRYWQLEKLEPRIPRILSKPPFDCS